MKFDKYAKNEKNFVSVKGFERGESFSKGNKNENKLFDLPLLNFNLAVSHLI